MKVLIMDGQEKRRDQIKDAIEKNQHEVIDCYSSNDFMVNVQENEPGLLVLDMDTWKKGKSIYNYFRVGNKLENLPIVLYNAEEDTFFIPDRDRHEKDRILPKSTDVETIADTVQQCL